MTANNLFRAQLWLLVVPSFNPDLSASTEPSWTHNAPHPSRSLAILSLARQHPCKQRSHACLSYKSNDVHHARFVSRWLRLLRLTQPTFPMLARNSDLFVGRHGETQGDTGRFRKPSPRQTYVPQKCRVPHGTCRVLVPAALHGAARAATLRERERSFGLGRSSARHEVLYSEAAAGDGALWIN